MLRRWIRDGLGAGLHQLYHLKTSDGAGHGGIRLSPQHSQGSRRTGGGGGKVTFGYERPEGICHCTQGARFVLSKACYTMRCPGILLNCIKKCFIFSLRGSCPG